MKNQKLISMVDFILEIDWMTTKEFCEKHGIPVPYFTGEVESSAKLLLQVDAIKHRMFVDYAKLLNKNITTEILTKNLGFESIDARGGYPSYVKWKYKIVNDQYGFRLEPYDSVDGCRIHKLNDLISYGIIYNS